MKFVSFEKQSNQVVHAHQFMDENGKWTGREDESPEMPETELSNALQALSPVICELMSIDKGQQGQLIPYKLKVTRDKQDDRSCQIWFNHIYEDLGSEQKEKTPPFRIDKPSGGASGVVVLDKDYLDIVGAAIYEAERYIKGERQQLTFEEYAERHEAITPKEDEGDLTLES